MSSSTFENPSVRAVVRVPYLPTHTPHYDYVDKHGIHCWRVEAPLGLVGLGETTEGLTELTYPYGIIEGLCHEGFVAYMSYKGVCDISTPAEGRSACGTSVPAVVIGDTVYTVFEYEVRRILGDLEGRARRGVLTDITTTLYPERFYYDKITCVQQYRSNIEYIWALEAQAERLGHYDTRWILEELNSMKADTLALTAHLTPLSY